MRPCEPAKRERVSFLDVVWEYSTLTESHNAMSKLLPTLTGYSTALFSTWYFWDEAGILFDCGDGVCSGLLQKGRKVKHVFISHADRDHLAGLLQFVQLNGREGLTVYYPKDCGSFPFLKQFCDSFDPHVSGTRWIPIDEGAEFSIRNDLIVRAIRNRHVESKLGTKSLTYIAEAISKKLNPKLRGLSGAEIARIRETKGEDAVSISKRTKRLIYSGDTPIENDGRYDEVETLIHEATFLTSKEIEPDNPKRNKHSSLEQVLEMVGRSRIQRLILGHFSSRYDPSEIDQAISHGCDQFGITIPVFRILPGQIVKNILAEK